MRFHQTLVFLLAFGVLPLVGCPKEEAPVATLPSAENGYGDPKANFAEGVRILKTPDKSGAINYESAYQWFDFAIKANGDYAKAYYNAAWTAEQMGNVEQAAT